MSHRDSKAQGRAVRLNSACLRLAIHWLLRGVEWQAITFRDDCTRTSMQLIATALLWAWSDELTLVDRFATARGASTASKS